MNTNIISRPVLRAMEEGVGITVLDPYGYAADAALRGVSPAQAGRVRVIRLDDTEHPVPMGLWDSRDPAAQMALGKGLARLLEDHFGESRDGAPTLWSAWLGNMLPGALRVFGRHLSLSLLCELTLDGGDDLRAAVSRLDPSLAAPSVRSDRTEQIQKALSVMSYRLRAEVAPAPFRDVFAAGANAVDFPSAVNTDTVTLIDLGARSFGPETAALLGSLVLLQLWEAVRSRRAPGIRHRLFIFDAQLFRCHPLPEMLRGGERSGLDVTLICRAAEELCPAVRRAAAHRILPEGIPLPADDIPDSGTAGEIRGRSLKTLWEPYREWGWRALTPTEERRYLNRLLAYENGSAQTDPEDIMALCSDEDEEKRTEAPEWLKKWIRYRLGEPEEAPPEGPDFSSFFDSIPDDDYD